MEWIDISVSAPTEFGSYLVTDGSDIQIMNYYGQYKGCHDWSSYVCNSLNVTHWKPLPEEMEGNPLPC
jgi:hypothetical protein